MFAFINKIRKHRATLIDVRIMNSAKLLLQSRDFYMRVYKREYNRYKQWIEPQKPSSLPIDVIIPIVAKDLDILPYAIKSIQLHVKHPIGRIYIVAPNSQAIRSVAEAQNAVFVDEKTVCAIAKSDINYVVNGVDRSGWIYQQILKYNFSNVGTCDNFLVLDADTFFIKDIAFESKGKFYFDFSDEYHKPYQQAYQLLTNYSHKMPVSFVAHYMLFNRAILKKLVSHIEAVTAEPLHIAIKNLATVIDSESAFSEYECYANYCLQLSPERYKLRYWFNKSQPKSMLSTVDVLISNIPDSKSLSFHSHNL